jgi:alpha-D-ribose 1-methylphosphonate 5-triphosphate synthase subunit PhnG
MATQTKRQAWMATLAKASPERLEDCLSKLDILPSYSFLRSPEIGLAMITGRAGVHGEVFNLGEITLTRCVVQLESPEEYQGVLGFGYISGRSCHHAELAALCDALLQCPTWEEQIQKLVIQPLQREYRQQQEQKERQTAATKVNFYTMLRGES